MPRKSWTSHLALSQKQRRRAVVEIVVSGLMRIPDGLDMTGIPTVQPVHMTTEESAESSPLVADRT